MLTRRALFGGASGAALLAWANPADAMLFRRGAASGGGGGGALTAEITFPGGSPVAGTLVYDIANGTDLGNYVAPTAGFTQRCVRVRHASLPNFLVDFRQDLVGGRIEVVCWNGEQLGTVPTQYWRHLPAYNLVVKLGGVAQTDIARGTTTQAIPYHYWGHRWRFQTSFRPVIRTGAQVISGGFLPDMSKTAARITGYSGIIVPTAPMLPSPLNGNGKNGDGSAMTLGPNGYLYTYPMIPDDVSVRLWGINCAGDDGGYRPEEGLITLWDGDWIISGTASSLNTMLQQAEMFSSQANALFLPHQVDSGPVNQKASVTNYLASSLYGYGSYYQTIHGGANGLSSGGVTGSISGSILTVTQSPYRPIQAGMIVKDYTNSGHTYGGVLPGTYILSQLTGTPGDMGTYQLSKTQSGTLPSGFTMLATCGEYQSKGDEHSPQCWYIPWVITEDPYFLEGSQYHTTWALQATIYHKETDIGNYLSDPTCQTGLNGAFTMPTEGITQERSFGWDIKNVASCWKMSPASPPSWLLSSGYWAAISSDFSRYADWLPTTHPTDQFYTVFHSMVEDVTGTGLGDTPQMFYKGYLTLATAFAHYIGCPVPAAAGHAAPSPWLTHLVYVFDFIRQACDASLASGWNVQSPQMHDLDPAFISSNAGATSGCTVSTPTLPASGVNCVSTWAQFWTYEGTHTQDSSPYPSNPSPGFIGPQTQLANLAVTLGAAAVAKSCGVTGAAAVKTWLDQVVDYSYPQINYGLSFPQQDGFSGL